ncbi:PREDICTED: GPI-anchor transamidase [Corvus brachyrhynchos]|uniref:GPI-anchor transamidase n=1 Tax=Corvus brachyrhynchos TaxID=85066 RepID=UPI00081641AA|nr:PREDICTED: GPI-anchor transamidase [Corvus brachyrhynchos]
MARSVAMTASALPTRTRAGSPQPGSSVRDQVPAVLAAGHCSYRHRDGGSGERTRVSDARSRTRLAEFGVPRAGCGRSPAWSPSRRIKQNSFLEVGIQITGQFWCVPLASGLIIVMWQILFQCTEVSRDWAFHSHIVLMLADDMACNPRNPKPATVFSHKNMELNVYGDDVEVDYRSYEVTVENFLRVLTGRIPPSTPRSKRLLSDDRSNILIYMTGHGGNGFLKFQDSEEITNVELADAFEQMWQKRRYNELLFIIDTCQGASMYERFYSPNIMALASSQVGEDSLSHQPDLGIGVHLMDRYTFYVLEFLEEIHPASQTNMNDLFQVCPKSLCVSTPGHRTDLFQRDPQNVLITDFFGSVRKVEITTETVSLDQDVAGFESKFPEEELATEPLKYAEQLPVAQIIHQKPKQKDWHPPGGFILGLWALIIMVFFKTYGIKHMKHVF